MQKGFDGIFAFTLFNSVATNLPPDPTVKLFKQSLRFTNFKIVEPSSANLGQFLDNDIKTSTSITPGNLADFILKFTNSIL